MGKPKLRMLQDSDLAFQKSIKQLDVLSLLRNLQSLILKQEQKMALTLKIENDLRYRQGLIATAKEMLKEGFDKQMIVKITKLTPKEIEKLEKEQPKKTKKG